MTELSALGLHPLPCLWSPFCLLEQGWPLCYGSSLPASSHDGIADIVFIVQQTHRRSCLYIVFPFSLFLNPCSLFFAEPVPSGSLSSLFMVALGKVTDDLIGQIGSQAPLCFAFQDLIAFSPWPSPFLPPWLISLLPISFLPSHPLYFLPSFIQIV